MTAEELLNFLEGNAMERLRWLVCRRFSLAPDAAPTDGACLWAAANMVLDARNGKKDEKAGANPAFDEERFESLKG